MKETKEKIEERLKLIKSIIEKNNVFSDMASLGKELFEGLKEYGILRKMELNPNDMIGGSIALFISTFPETISIKLWFEGGTYYMSMFRKIEGMFDQQLTGTFNDSGVISLKDLDEFEERILDFIANEIYNRKHKEVLTED